MRIAAEVEKVDVIPNKNKPLEKLTEKNFLMNMLSLKTLKLEMN